MAEQKIQNTKNPSKKNEINHINSKAHLSEPTKRPFIDQSSLQRKLANPKGISTVDTDQLQQTVGNQALARHYGTKINPIIQPKLTLGPVNDKYEQEADRVAKEVVSKISSTGSTPPSHSGNGVQRQEEEEIQMKPISSVQRQEEEEVQMKPISSVQRQEEEEMQMKSASLQRRQETDMHKGGSLSENIVTAVGHAKSGGQPIADTVRQPLESAFNADFENVKIHTDSQSDSLNHSIQSRAFTTGQDIFFRQGEYRPETSGGQELLAHELTHTIQQGASAQQKDISSLQPKIIQRKGEFKTQYNKNPAVAKAAVHADYAKYAEYQEQFEKKLGVGLHSNVKAMEGADIMLSKMVAAMKKAGFEDERIDKALAIKKPGSKSVDLGGVLVDDVKEVLASGNLREKMGMVYQSRFEISKALADLALKKKPGIKLGKQLKSPEMVKEIEDLNEENERITQENEGLPKESRQRTTPVSYKLLKRRDSVSNQPRQSNKKKKQKLITGDTLKEMGVPLSEREKRAAKNANEEFIPGSEYYNVNEDKITEEHEQLRRVVAGLSGSTDMYFNIAKHLAMNEGERKKFRLAALGQMIVNNDHSYHEIMHVAKTQGNLPDYPDDLPIGYTTLAPLSENEILSTTGLEDFPGDKQTKEALTELTTKEDITAVGGDPAKRSNKYPAILTKVDAYHKSPKIQTLEEIKTLVDVWMDAKKPGARARKKTKKNWQNNPRRQALEALKANADRLLKIEAEYLKMDLRSAKLYILEQVENAPNENKQAIQNKMVNFIDAYIKKMTEDANLGEGLDEVNVLARQQLEQKKKELNDVKTYITTSELSRGSDDLQNKDFRASKADLDMDLSNVNIDDSFLGKSADKDAPLKANLGKDLEGYVVENRKIIGKAGGDISNIPDLEEQPTDPMGIVLKQRRERDEALTPLGAQYTQDQNDFINNIDTSMMEAFQPGSPIENLLRQIEGKPMPQELQAIQAYAQPGFYKMMNKVLNKSGDKKFMKTVPPEALSLVSLATSGLRKMKPYTGGSVYRGEPGVGTSKIMNDYTFRPKLKRQGIWESSFNKPKTYKQFVSTSKRAYSSYITTDNKWKAIEIRNVKTGVDISAISNTLYEREVLFPPGTKFNVVSVEDKFVTQVKGEGDKVTWEDLPNKYAEAPISSNQPGRIKIIMEEA